MTNSYLQNPIFIDSIEASAVTIPAGGFQFPWNITKIIWYNPTADNDTVVLQNGVGQLKWKAIAETAGGTQVHNFIPPLKIKGLIVPTLASGHLLIYLDE